MSDKVRGRVRIVGRGGWRVQSWDMLALLGVKRLPAEGMPEREVQGVRVFVLPRREFRPGERKRSSHRIMARCVCGRVVPFGRLHQHVC